MKCPSSKQFNKSREVLGTIQSFNAFKLNGEQDLHLAPNGNQSELFSELVNQGGEENALRIKAKLLTIKDKLELDSNDEVLLRHVVSSDFNDSNVVQLHIDKTRQSDPVVVKRGVNTEEFAGVEVSDIIPIYNNGLFDRRKQKVVKTTPVFETEFGDINVDDSNHIKNTKQSKRNSSNLFNGDTNPKLKSLFETNQNKKLAGLLIRSIKYSFGNAVKIVEETNSSTKNAFGEVKNGWVDTSGNIHLNMESITPETVLHELGHILEPLIKKANKEGYELVMADINKGIESGTGLYHEIYRRVNLNDKLSKDQKLSEVFAESLAIDTLNKMQEKVSDLGMVNESPETIFEAIKRKWNNIRESVEGMFGSIFGDKKIKTVGDIGSFLAVSMKGDTVFKFTQEERLYMDEFFNERGNQFRDESNGTNSQVVIGGNKDLMDFLNDRTNIKDVRLAVAESMANKAIIGNIKNNDDKLIIDHAGETYFFEYHDKKDFDRVVSEIKDKIVDPMYDLKEAMFDNIVTGFSKDLVGKQNDIYKTIAGEHTTAESVDRFLNFTGLNRKADAVLRYSQLKDHKNPKLAALYDESMAANDDYLMIIHNDGTDSKLKVGIISGSVNSLVEGSNLETDSNNIFANLMTDKDYYSATPLGAHNKMTMNNIAVDRSNLGIGLLMLHINNKTNGDVTFGKTGTIHVTAQKTTAKMISNVEGIRSNVAILRGIPGFSETLKPSGLKSLLDNDDTFKKKIDTSVFTEVKSYLDTIASEDESDSIFAYQAKKLLEELEKDTIAARIKVLDVMSSMLINKYSNKAKSNALFQLVAKASRELKAGKIGTINDLNDISALAVKVQSALHANHDYIQDVVNVNQKASMKINKHLIDDIHDLAGTTKHRGLMRDVLDQVMKDKPFLKSKGFIVDIGSQIYEHFYKTKKVKVVDKNGEFTGAETIVKLSELHFTLDDADTKALYDKGKITDADLKATNKMLDIMKERWIDLLHHEGLQKQLVRGLADEEYRREDAEIEYNGLFPDKGMIPIIEKSTSELLVDKKVKKAAKKGLRQSSLSENLFEDSVRLDDGTIDQMGTVSNSFSMQKRADHRLALGGLKMLNGEMVSFNPDLNTEMSTDAWKTFTYFDMAILRKIEHERNVIPVARGAIALMTQLHDEGKSQTNSIAFVKEYINRNTYRQNEDDKNDIDIGVTPVDVPGLTRTLKSMMNLAVLPFKLSIGIMSSAFNMKNVALESLAATIAKSDSTVPRAEYFMKAFKESFANAKKLQQVALTHQVFGRSESEILTNPFVNVTDFSAFNQLFTNIFNWGTDTWARSVTMAAIMEQDGSYDAYGYDKKTGEVTYDETKDKRFYENGKRKEDAQSKALYEGVMLDVMELLDLDKRPDKLPLGYGLEDSVAMKNMADTRVVGAFSDDVAAMGSNTWVGNLFTSFRQYASVRLFNFGVFGNRRKTTVGGRIVAVENPDKPGEYISTKETKEMAGALQSWSEAYKILKDSDIDSQDKWDALGDTDKHNLVKAALSIIMFMLVAGFVMAGDDDDEKYDKTTMGYWATKMLSDLTIMSLIMDVNETPFPPIDFIIRSMERGRFDKLLPYSGSLTEVNQVINSDDE